MKKQIRKKICKFVSLHDRCLIIFMIVFIIQSIIAVFFRRTGAYAPDIDMVARSTMSAIFGYFISSNFMSKDYVNKKKEVEDKKKIRCICELEESKEAGEEEEDEQELFVDQKVEDRIQIIIVTVIGLISLLILFFSRYLVHIPAEAASIISQYRGFLSGCIGFLLGIPPEKKYK